MQSIEKLLKTMVKHNEVFAFFPYGLLSVDKIQTNIIDIKNRLNLYF